MLPDQSLQLPQPLLLAVAHAVGVLLLETKNVVENLSHKLKQKRIYSIAKPCMAGKSVAVVKLSAVF